MNKNSSYTAFAGFTHIATGNLEIMLKETHRYMEAHESESVLIFDNSSGKQVDFDFSGSLAEVMEKALPPEAPRGRGRPSLGVTSAEISLLPRHWEWLADQPKKASATVRRLVESAIRNMPAEERIKSRIDAAGRFLWVLAGNLPEFEEASRALYARKWIILDALTRSWPEDVKKHLGFMLSEARNPFTEGNEYNLRIIPELDGQYRADAAFGKKPWELSAVNLAAAIAAGTFSAVEVAESFLERIAEVNGGINAVTEIFSEEALEAAAGVDRDRASGRDAGPLAGVPFTVKGNLDVAGYATTNGIPAMKDAVASKDCPLVARLRKAGAIPIGHTNLPDMSLRFHTSSSLYGATLNPWNPAFTPGGSSGGEGAALAAGMSALGIGNDAGGSLRIPALFNGVAALKPGYGRIPGDRSIGPRDLTLASQLIPVDGFLARSVADLHAAYQLASGPHPSDPRAVAAPLFEARKPGPLRIAVVANPGNLGVSRGNEAAVEAAAAILESKGHRLERAELPEIAGICDAYGKMIFTEFYQILPVLKELLGKDGQSYINLAMQLQKPEDLGGYIQLAALRQGYQRQWSEFFTEYDLVLGPVYTGEIVPPDYDIRGPEEYREVSEGMRLCSATSFIGVPAVAVPTGVNGKMPAGVQLIGGMYREGLCLEAAAVIEEAAGVFTPVEPTVS